MRIWAINARSLSSCSFAKGDPDRMRFLFFRGFARPCDGAGLCRLGATLARRAGLRLGRGRRVPLFPSSSRAPRIPDCAACAQASARRVNGARECGTDSKLSLFRPAPQGREACVRVREPDPRFGPGRQKPSENTSVHPQPSTAWPSRHHRGAVALGPVANSDNIAFSAITPPLSIGGEGKLAATAIRTPALQRPSCSSSPQMAPGIHHRARARAQPRTFPEAETARPRAAPRELGPGPERRAAPTRHPDGVSQPEGRACALSSRRRRVQQLAWQHLDGRVQNIAPCDNLAPAHPAT